MIDGDTKLIAHIGYPTATFRAPLIYNPWFARHGINALVVPLGVTGENFREAFPQICRFTNFHGALITMPHKAAVVGWLDEASMSVRVAGACNAVRRSEDGKLVGDLFDGEGFVRGVARAGRSIVERASSLSAPAESAPQSPLPARKPGRARSRSPIRGPRLRSGSPSGCD
jgi:shikimate dehydrogenase